MKILHVAETIKGGVATVVDQLVLDQLKREHDVKVLVPCDQSEYLTDPDSITTYKKTGRNVFSFLCLAVAFLKIIFQYKPDIIHLHSSFAGAICRAVLFLIPFQRAKVIYCPHSFSFMMNVSQIKKKLYALIEKVLSVVTDKIICVGNAEYDAADKFGINRDKLTIIFNGVEAPKNIDMIEKEYLKNGVINFLFVGRFDYQKGFDLLTQLFEYTQSFKVHFTVIGDFVHTDVGGKPQFPHVTYLGWLPKERLVEYYKTNDLLIMPSRWEGLPMVALEAFSMGLPLFASNCSSLAELITDDVDGFLFENNSFQSLIYQFNEVYQKLEKEQLEKISYLVREKFENKFRAEQMLDATLNLYKDLV